MISLWEKNNNKIIYTKVITVHSSEGLTVNRSLILWWNESNDTGSILRDASYMCTAITRGKYFNYLLAI